MGKKNYLIIGATILIFAVAIIVILLSGNKEDWTTDIKNSQKYQMTMIDCNGREKKLDNSVLDSLSKKWNELSNNGPWTGDTNTCYTTLTISYDNNGIVKQKEIIIIDNTSIVLNLNTSTIYYTNANSLIAYLNSLFIE